MSECLLVRVDDEVREMHPDFDVDAERLTDLVLRGDGPVTLEPEDLERAPIEFKAGKHVVHGSTVRPVGLVKRRNEAAGYRPDAVVARVNVGPHAEAPGAEDALVHELVHVEQMLYRPAIGYWGAAVRGAMAAGGVLATTAIKEVVDTAMAHYLGPQDPTFKDMFGIGLSAVGAAAGFQLSWSMAPNEREAIRVAAAHEYQGIVTL